LDVLSFIVTLIVGNALRKQTTLVRVPLSAYNFFFLNMFYTHNHSIKLCSDTSII